MPFLRSAARQKQAHTVYWNEARPELDANGGNLIFEWAKKNVVNLNFRQRQKILQIFGTLFWKSTLRAQYFPSEMSMVGIVGLAATAKQAFLTSTCHQLVGFFCKALKMIILPQGSRKKYYKIDPDDFKRAKPQCVDTAVNVRKVGQLSAFAQTITAKERMEFGQRIARQWKLLECLDDAVNKVISVKKRIRSKGGVIEDTNDFDKYLADIKHNIDFFSR